MLTILWGLAGSGKSHVLTHELLARAKQGGRHFLLSPEQFSHEQERTLSRYGGPPASHNTEVLTFGRLAERVLSETGGLSRPLLDKGGRLLMLRRALDAVQDHLSVWREPARRPDFWPLLLRTVDECKMYQATPETLAPAEQMASDQTEAVLHDLRIILTAYESLVRQQALDPRDLLTQAVEMLPHSVYGQKDVTWAVDGFSRFTVQEKEILAGLMALCTDVTVSLTGRPDGSCDGLFAVSLRTAQSLERLAGRSGISVAHNVLEAMPRYRNAALAHLSRYLLAEQTIPYGGTSQGIETIRLEDKRAECAFAAARVRTLVRDEGYRYRDIAVVARHFDAYASLFAQQAERLGIPLFLDRKEDVLQKPPFSFVSAALHTVSHGYPHDALFRMLKTGLFGLSLDACDRLENYALKYNLKGKDWRANCDWLRPPNGHERSATTDDHEALCQLNGWRRQVVEPLERLRQCAARDKTVRGQARAVYEFLLEIALPERLEARCNSLYEAGEVQRADQIRQMWDMLCHALDQCVGLLDQSPCTLSEFSETLSLLLTQYEVGSIPVALDRLSCGDADRIRRRSLRCVILLGATGTDLPSPPQPSGLLGREERAWLSECGVEMAPNADERMEQELDIIYSAFTLPSERLVITWPARGDEGEDNHPSFAVTALQELLGLKTMRPDIWDSPYTQAPGPCLEWLAERPDDPQAMVLQAAIENIPELRRKLETIHSFQPTVRGHLSKDTVKSLYGKTFTLSPSRIETFMQCPYSYFLKYGLRAKPRLNAAFSALDRGNFIHAVLEKTLRAVMAQGGCASVTDEQACSLAHQASESYIQDSLQGHRGQTARFTHLFARLERAVDAVVTNVMAEMRRSDFSPLDMELRFADGVEDALPSLRAGQSSQVTGIADRVDGWISGDTLYVRVVDYKTGRRVCRLGDLYYGLGLQMFLYLFALECEGLARYSTLGAKRILPAGVLYLPARESYLSMEPDIPDERLRQAMASALRRDGLVLDDPDVIEAMEKGIDGRAEFIPVQFKQRGHELSALSSVGSLERFGRLRRHVDKLLLEMERSLLAGDASAHPACKGPVTACELCDYRTACQFDERAGDRQRKLSALSGRDFWQRLEEDFPSDEKGALDT